MPPIFVLHSYSGSYLPGNRRRRGNRRTGQVDLAGGVAHAADKVAVGGGHAALALGQDAHMAAQAGPAGGGGDNAARFDKILHQAQFHRVQIDLLGGRDDDGAHMACRFPAPQHLSRQDQVLQPAVGAGADDNLIDFYIADLIKGMRVLG
ncbi:hypothetical protein SDC9_156405 [bioreactor metagenome]|uniref:Uncharacterized protein n=1 Tax=bioreactor metagenome TaxID=1076179 RepID=A0A645F4M3_9ZZZZ